MDLGTRLFAGMAVVSFGFLLGPCCGIFAFIFNDLSTKKWVTLGIVLDLIITIIMASSFTPMIGR